MDRDSALANNYLQLPSIFYQEVAPVPVKNPQWVIFNHDLAAELGFSQDDFLGENSLEILSGNKVFPNSTPIALAYAGHQFGHFAGQLGDGRAHVLGQLNSRDIQLKGSGQTPYSRQGDGRSALGPAIREYVISEAMHALGASTTRTLAVILTGETVMRETGVGENRRYGEVPGGLSIRVARSHIRVGSFEYAAMKGVDQVEALLTFSIQNYFPELDQDRPLDFLQQVCEQNAKLVAKWMSLGFIHGVMNTDNTSIVGDTIDYGPCAFMDTYHHQMVFSSIDHYGRYNYSNQAPIMAWNCTRLAETLLPLIDTDSEVAANKCMDVVSQFRPIFERHRIELFAKKLNLNPDAKATAEEIDKFLENMEAEKKDFTNTFYTASKKDGEGDMSSGSDTEGVSPFIIPRNHNVEAVIRAAEDELNFEPLQELMTALKTPFDDNELTRSFSEGPSKDEVVAETFCGT